MAVVVGAGALFTVDVVSFAASQDVRNNAVILLVALVAAIAGRPAVQRTARRAAAERVATA